ncbi:MAG: TldD/PmbA family protein [Nitrososphaerota archaeon]|nr:TldD/PmbA family protein [Nitrososphaerota archaeon]
MEDKDAADHALAVALREGADYAEARLHRNVDTVASLKNGEAEPPGHGESYGLGMRVMCGGALAFGATNRLGREGAAALAASLVRNARSAAALFGKKVAMSPEDSYMAKWGVPEKERMEDVDAGRLLSALKDLEGEVLSAAGEGKMPFRLYFLATGVEEKYFTSTQGTRIESRVPRLAFSGVLTGRDSGMVVQRRVQTGGSGGWEVFEGLGIRERLKSEAGTVARILSSASKFMGGEMDVIVGPEVAGIMAHESVGHPGEADRIMGREAAQAGESYLSSSDLGRQVGNGQAMVSDDPTVPGSSGFYLYDDEGVPARKRSLIDGGRIGEFLQNRETAADFDTRSNGAARADSYDREPIVRMANTFVEPGDMALEEMISGVKEGVLLKNFMEWNIDDKRFNQRYVGHEAYKIEKGELKGLVRNPVLEITTTKLWGSIGGRSRELAFDAATCGKGDPMQGIPVWHGGPHMLLNGVRVGAR